VKHDNNALVDVPKEFWLDRSFCLKMVKRNGNAFLHIPDYMRTDKVCLAAIKQYGSVCGKIPEELQSEGFFTEAVKVNDNGKALKYVPEQYRTLQVCRTAIETHPGMAEELLSYVPKAMRARVKKAAGI
jgi:hypothetical protein